MSRKEVVIYIVVKVNQMMMKVISKLIEYIPKHIKGEDIGPDELVDCFSHYSEDKYHHYNNTVVS